MGDVWSKMARKIATWMVETVALRGPKLGALVFLESEVNNAVCAKRGCEDGRLHRP